MIKVKQDGKLKLWETIRINIKIKRKDMAYKRNRKTYRMYG